VLPFLQSPFYTPGRQGAKITSIVLHWMDGNLAATEAEFAHGSRRVSAHYGIEDANVRPFVRDTDTAWHAGDWIENTVSIGIEHSAAPGRDASPATIATSVALITRLCRDYGIDPGHIYPHSRFFPTACPGTLPLPEIVARVRAGLGQPAPATPPQSPSKPPTTSQSPSKDGLKVNILDFSRVTAASTTWVRGPGVGPLQSLLQIRRDGLGGSGTRAALVSYQRHAALNPDAVFGPVTASSMLAGR